MTVSTPPPKPSRRRFIFEPTQAGFVYIMVSLFIFVAAVNSGVNLLYFLFGMTVAALLLSVFLSWVCLRKLSITRDFGEHAIAGEPADIAYLFTNKKWFWPSLGVHFQEVNSEVIETPRGFIFHLRATGRGRAKRLYPAKASTRLVAKRRGLLLLKTLELSTTFPFGFLRHTRRIHVPQEMVIYPRIGMLNRHLALQYRESIESGTMTSNRRGGNDEFYGVREYRAGDNIRAIHWRSTARSGQIMIREMAANAPPQLIIILNLRSWRDHADNLGGTEGQRVERAIELAAALVCYGFFENFAVGLAIAGLTGQIPPSPQMGRDARSRMLRQLAVLDPLQVRPDVGIEFPNRLAGRAEFIVVTLHQRDAVADLLWSPGERMESRRGTKSGTTVLAMDAPEAHSWVDYLSPEETMRLLRERAGA